MKIERRLFHFYKKRAKRDAHFGGAMTGVRNQLAELIIGSKIFHESWYRAMHPDLQRSHRSALDHFLEDGVRENASPHPLFDPVWYLETYEDVAVSGMAAIHHYLNSGGREWRAPGPMVDMDRYFEQHRASVEATSTGSILEDFVRSEDRSAAFQFFDDEAYAEKMSQAPRGFNRRLDHFFAVGLVEGISAHPLLNIAKPDKRYGASYYYQRFVDLFVGMGDQAATSHPSFDPNFYRSQVGSFSGDALIHHLRTWPFSSAWLHPLIDLSHWKRKALKLGGRAEPLSLFLREGLTKSKNYNPYFDVDFYTKQYGHLFKDGETALEHYMEYGHLHWFEPGEKFGQRYYIRQNKDQVRHRWPAMADYLHRGRQLGASPLPAKPFLDLTTGLSPEKIAEDIHSFGRAASEPALVTVIVAAYKNIQYTLRCVWSILQANDKTPLRVLIVDDQSPDGSGAELAALLDGVSGLEVVINHENLGFLRSCNAAAGRVSTEYLFFLNNDTVVLDGWLDELMDTFNRHPDVGLVGSKLVYPNGLLQEAGGLVWDEGAAANYGRFDDPSAPEYNFERDVDYISGAAILLKKDLWDRVGGFSDDLAPAYYEDTDLAMKIREAGQRVIYQPLSCVVHFEGISSGTDISGGIKKYQAINADKFAKKWAEQLFLLGKKGDFSRQVVDRHCKGRILIIDADLPRPDRDSGSVTAFYMMKLLAELGFRVSFIPANLRFEGKYVMSLRRLGVEVLHMPYVENIDQYLAEHGTTFDLFIVSRATTAERYFTQIKRDFPETPIVFDTVDLHHLRMIREAELENDMAKMGDALAMREKELGMLQMADASIVVSEYEASYIRQEIGPFPCVHLPLIYEQAERTSGFDDRRDVAFVGGFRHPPNIDAVKFLCTEVWPLVRAQDEKICLHIIGSSMPNDFAQFADRDINLVGFVDDLEAYLSSIRVSVAPLRYGAGVKGKVGNSLRMGVPVVGTPIATEGMGLIDQEHVLIASNANRLAEYILMLHKDPELWERLSVNGQEFVLKTFGFEAARNKLARLCRVLIPPATD